MMTVGPTLAFVAATFVFAARAAAQGSPQQSAARELPTWEIGGSLGAFVMSDRRLTEIERKASVDRSTGDDWIAAAYGLDVGHYWTPHLKIEARFIQRSQHDTIDFETVQLAGVPSVAARIVVVTAKTAGLATAMVGATYQFRENAFLHPYVSAGVRLGWLREHRVRGQRDGSNPFPYTVLALDERTHQLLTHPVVAGGAKWYLTQLVFLRPEAALAFGRSGVTDLTFGVSVGRDF